MDEAVLDAALNDWDMIIDSIPLEWLYHDIDDDTSEIHPLVGVEGFVVFMLRLRKLSENSKASRGQRRNSLGKKFCMEKVPAQRSLWKGPAPNVPPRNYQSR